jgi:hypothetical protein
MKPTALLVALAASSAATSQQGGPGDVAVARGQRQVCTMSDPKELEWKKGYSWGPGVAATGDSTIVMKSDGSIRFRTHFRATGAPDYKYSIACALRDEKGRLYKVQRKGEVFGTLSGRRNKEHTVDSTTKHGDVQKNWGHIVKGNRKMHCDAKVNVDERRLMDEVAGLVKQYGPTSGEVITIII